MPTIEQLKRNLRKQNRRRSKAPSLTKNPQKKGVCIKIFTRTPKKPNSAIRKIARVRLSSKKRVNCIHSWRRSQFTRALRCSYTGGSG